MTRARGGAALELGHCVTASKFITMMASLLQLLAGLNVGFVLCLGHLLLPPYRRAHRIADAVRIGVSTRIDVHGLVDKADR